MKKKDLITKWLDYNLNEEEQEAFKQLDAHASLNKLDRSLHHFKAPVFEEAFTFPEHSKNSSKNRTFNWPKAIAAMAALWVVSLGLYFIFFPQTSDTLVALSGETKELVLPDRSVVQLNAGSEVSYTPSQWDNKRELQLKGEAFFKVAKGATFSVLTSQGKVQVLGTQFNVKSRKNYFEVSCYEGLVAVSVNHQEMKLSPGNRVVFVDGKMTQQKTPYPSPSWLENRSVFESTPYQEVVEELERQYAIEVTYNTELSHRLFTGSFTHKNLESALQAITIPLTLSYEISGNQVTLKP